MDREENASLEENVSGEEEDVLVFELSKEYDFEGKKIGTLDLRNLREATANDMIRVNRILSQRGFAGLNTEYSLEYACVLAGQVTDLPMEFYFSLRMQDAMKLKNRVSGFLLGNI